MFFLLVKFSAMVATGCTLLWSGGIENVHRKPLGTGWDQEVGHALERLVLAGAAALSLKTVVCDHGHWWKRLPLWVSCLDGREGSLQTVVLSVHRGSDVHPSSERLGGTPEVFFCVCSIWWPQGKQIRDWEYACDSTAICDWGLRRQHCHGGILEDTLRDFRP